MASKRSGIEFAFLASSRLLGLVVVVVFLMIISTRSPPSPAAFADASTAETAEPSWTKWASDKFSEEMELRQENARTASGKMKEKAGDVTAKAKDALSSAAEYAIHKAGEVKDSVADMAGNVVGIMRTEVEEGDEDTAAERAYEGAKQREAEAGERAGDTVSGGTRRRYEAAKEEESEAAGGMGAKMQEEL